MKYSKLQYFFWLISGSEISVLEKCPNEYNRHANIGMMILITALFAGFTAFVAGSTFAENNIIGVVLFSLLWALVIFSIDRSMVNSIKRNPTIARQPFLSYFIPRLILAFILAFFMSIPLDHIVFKERIARQMSENNQQDWLKRQGELNMGYDVARRDSNVTSLNREVEELDNILASDCPLPEYQNAITNYNACTPQINPLKYDHDRKVSARKAYYSTLQKARDNENRKLPDSLKLPINPPVDDTWWKLKGESNVAYKKWKDKEAECKNLKNKADSIYSQWRSGVQTDRDRTDSLHRKQESDLRIDRDSIRVKSENFKTDIDSMTGFDTQFVTLFLMPNWGVQILKWLIFIALLVIEILPTYLKLKTPISQYDWKLYEGDEIMANDSKSRITSEKDISQQSENHRKAKEVELNNSIVDKVAEIELKIARESLVEWEIEARNKMKQDIDNANRANNEESVND